MPLSTWTTRSPTLRSRKSEMNVRAGGLAPLVDAAFLLEEIGLGEEQQIRVGRCETRARAAGRHEHGRAIEVVGLGDRARANVVVGEQLDRAFGAARRCRHEHDASAAFARLPDFVDPVADAAVVRERRQARDVVRASPGPSSIASSADAAAPEPATWSSSSQLDRDRLVRRHLRGRAPPCPSRWRATASSSFRPRSPRRRSRRRPRSRARPRA